MKQKSKIIVWKQGEGKFQVDAKRVTPCENQEKHLGYFGFKCPGHINGICQWCGDKFSDNLHGKLPAGVERVPTARKKRVK